MQRKEKAISSSSSTTNHIQKKKSKERKEDKEEETDIFEVFPPLRSDRNRSSRKPLWFLFPWWLEGFFQLGEIEKEIKKKKSQKDRVFIKDDR